MDTRGLSNQADHRFALNLNMKDIRSFDPTCSLAYGRVNAFLQSHLDSDKIAKQSMKSISSFVLLSKTSGQENGCNITT